MAIVPVGCWKNFRALITVKLVRTAPFPCVLPLGLLLNCRVAVSLGHVGRTTGGDLSGQFCNFFHGRVLQGSNIGVVGDRDAGAVGVIPFLLRICILL